MAEDRNQLVLQATGSVAAAPDMANVTAGVVAQADRARDAMAEQRTRMTAVVTALREAGVASGDIQTTGLSLTPQYKAYSRGSQPGAPQIDGYQAANRVTAIVRDMQAVGPVLDALVEAGANTIDAVSFDHSKRSELEDQARREAVATLLARAALYADAAGFELGPITDLSENTHFGHFESRTRAASVSATPVEGGTMQISVTVNGTFAIGE